MRGIFTVPLLKSPGVCKVHDCSPYASFVSEHAKVGERTVFEVSRSTDHYSLHVRGVQEVHPVGFGKQVFLECRKIW